MPHTTAYRFGDVVLVPFPFTDQTGVKRRPAIVVSSDEYQRRRSDVIIMAVTSHALPTTSFGEVSVMHWKKAGLIKPSVVKPVLATIEKSLILRKLGALPDTDRQSLRNALGDIIG